MSTAPQIVMQKSDHKLTVKKLNNKRNKYTKAKKWEKNTVVLEYTRLGRYLNLEK